MTIPFGQYASIGQYAPVSLPGEAPSLTEKRGRPNLQDHRVGYYRSDPAQAHRHKTFFACGSSAPVRVEREGGPAAWLVGTLAVPSVQGHGLPLP